jgi:hypothetical protein
MNVFTRSLLVLPLAFGAPVAVKAIDTHPLTAAEASALSQPAAHLDTLRAGAMTHAGLGADERATLRQVQAQTGDRLAELRGGMTDHDLLIILVVVAVVALLIIAL